MFFVEFERGIVLNSKKVGAVVVLYNPDSDIYEKLKQYSSFVDVVAVYDNTPSMNHSDEIRFKCKKDEIENIVILSVGANIGIATALNNAIKVCIDQCCDEVFLFDQDSFPAESNYFTDMRSELFALNSKDSRVVCLAPNIKDEANPDANYKWLANNGCYSVLYKRVSLKDNWNRSVLVAITSGTLIYTKVFNDVGWFRDDYFIDYVDTEYCLRLINNNYKIMASSSVLLHNLGSRKEVSMLGFKFFPTNHSAIRRYYIARNSIDMWKNYAFKNADWAVFDFTASLFNAFRIIFFEKDRVNKIKHSLQGFLHGLIGRMGAR